jgi:peptide/nickel transport system substrate-binding protein
MADSEKLSRRKFLTATGGAAATAAVAGCPDDGGENGDGGGAGNNTDDGTTPTEQQDQLVYAEHAQKAQDAWERVENNPSPDAEDIRNEAYVEMEEALRDDMVLMPLYHPLTERFWYNWVDFPKSGTLGKHRQQLHDVEVDTSSEHKSENVLNLINAKMSSLDPIQSTDTASGIVIGQVYENLVNYPNGVPEIEQQLAKGVEISDDLLTYTVTLKEGIQYHDGRELTAADVKYAWRRLAESPNSERANFILEGEFLGIEHETNEEEGVGPLSVVPDSMAIEVVDDYTLEFTIAEPEPAALDILAYDSFGAMPEGFVGDVEGYDGEHSQDEVSTSVMNGNGPFQLEEWVEGDEVTLTAFGNYHGGEPSIDGIHWAIIEDDDAHWTYVNERNADVFEIPTPFYEPDNVDAQEDDRGRQVGTYGPLENGDEVNYLGVSELAVYYVAWNVPKVPQAVRHAIAYVTDHQELIDEVFKSRGVPAFSFTPPGMWPTGNDGYESYTGEWPYSPNETDRESARQVLEEAGFSEEEPFEMTLTTYASEVFQEFGRLTRDKLDGLGVSLQLEEAEFGTLISRGEDGDLEFYSLGWIWSWSDPAYGLYGFEPKNTNTEIMPEETNGYYLDWQVGLEEE